MKLAAIVIAFFLSLNFGISQEQNTTPTALEIVNKRMELYNQHNFEGFIKLYSDNEVVQGRMLKSANDFEILTINK